MQTKEENVELIKRLKALQHQKNISKEFKGKKLNYANVKHQLKNIWHIMI